jgi:hypothetical protein
MKPLLDASCDCLQLAQPKRRPQRAKKQPRSLKTLPTRPHTLQFAARGPASGAAGVGPPQHRVGARAHPDRVAPGHGAGVRGGWVGGCCCSFLGGSVESWRQQQRSAAPGSAALAAITNQACPTTHPRTRPPGGTLTDAVTSRWESALGRGGIHLTEPEARFYFRQFIGALEYCHENRVAHRWVVNGVDWGG